MTFDALDKSYPVVFLILMLKGDDIQSAAPCSYVSHLWCWCGGQLLGAASIRKERRSGSKMKDTEITNLGSRSVPT